MTAIVLLLLPFTWVFYLAVMALTRVWKDLHPAIKAFAAPVVITGVLLDVLTNAILGTLYFRELPREWLLTTRLTRLKLGTGWRSIHAFWICKHMLNPFDPYGPHC